jgi:hypothetical protein
MVAFLNVHVNTKIVYQVQDQSQEGIEMIVVDHQNTTLLMMVIQYVVAVERKLNIEGQFSKSIIDHSNLTKALRVLQKIDFRVNYIRCWILTSRSLMMMRKALGNLNIREGNIQMLRILQQEKIKEGQVIRPDSPGIRLVWTLSR